LPGARNDTDPTIPSPFTLKSYTLKLDFQTLDLKPKNPETPKP